MKYWEPPTEDPKYWEASEPNGPTLEEVANALCDAERKTLGLLFSLSGNVDGISHCELRDVLTFEDWAEAWPNWFPDIALPSREAFAPLIASIAELIDAAHVAETWEEPYEYECECRKRRCAYCGDSDY